MYISILKEAGKKVRKDDIHSTRFKTLLQSQLTGWTCVIEGRDIIFSDDNTVSAALANKMTSEAQRVENGLLKDAALVTRKYIIDTKQIPFSGNFSNDCLTNPIPKPISPFLVSFLKE